MLRPQSIHRPPSTGEMEIIHRIKNFLLGGLSIGGIFFYWRHSSVDGGKSHFSWWTVDGGLIGDTLGGKFKFVEVTLFLHFTTTIYAT